MKKSGCKSGGKMSKGGKSSNMPPWLEKKAESKPAKKKSK